MILLAAPASDYGLFLSDEDPRKGIWLESGRTLDYYMLRNGVNITALTAHASENSVNEVTLPGRRGFLSEERGQRSKWAFDKVTVAETLRRDVLTWNLLEHTHTQSPAVGDCVCVSKKYVWKILTQINVWPEPPGADRPHGLWSYDVTTTWTSASEPRWFWNHTVVFSIWRFTSLGSFQWRRKWK